MRTISCKVLVLGGGPGGYVCAIRAGKLGLDCVLVEQGRLGGTCLNVGCIPSKALIHCADRFYEIGDVSSGAALGIKTSPPELDWNQASLWRRAIVSRLNGGVAGLLKRANVRTISGRGVMSDGKTCEVETPDGKVRISAEHVVIATGSEAAELPSFPFDSSIISSTELFELDVLPQKIAIVGAGYIGLELGIACRKLGLEVTVIESSDKILPQYDSELTAPVEERLIDLGVRLFTGSRPSRFDPRNSQLIVRTAGEQDCTVTAEKMLVAVGRRAKLSGWGLENLDLATTRSGLKVDDSCRTSMRNVWAIGDVTSEPMLAHRAMAQGELVAEAIAGKTKVDDHIAIPAICFTDPEIVSVGLSPAAAEKAGYKTISANYPLAGNGRALTIEANSGFVRVVARSEDHRLLGIQAVGRGVSELAASFALAVEMQGCLEDVAATIHAHPTIGECFQEASMRALGKALHI